MVKILVHSESNKNEQKKTSYPMLLPKCNINDATNGLMKHGAIITQNKASLNVFNTRQDKF